MPLFILLLADRHGQEDFPLDDAWIHMVYGRAVAQKRYLAYKDGVASRGCNSPLRAYLIGIIHLLLHRLNLIIWGTKILGIILHCGLVYLSFKIACNLTGSLATGLWTALILSLSPPLAIASLSGMEITLGCFLFMAASYTFIKKNGG